MEEHVEFKNAFEEVLDGRFHLPEKATDKVCIILHGLRGSKNLLWLHDIADRLADNGIAALRFDFSGHGDSEGKFEEFGFQKGEGDFASALAFVKERGFKKISALGHSIGSAIIMRSLHTHPEIRCYVGIAGPSRPGRKGNDAIVQQIYKKAGVSNGAMLSELKDSNLFEQLKKVEVPTLLIHGTNDGVVPSEDSRLVFDALKGPKKFESIEGGDHLLLKETQKVINLASEWIIQYLS